MTPLLVALINGAVAGSVLTGMVAIALKLTSRRTLNAATRYVVWWLTLVLVIMLPVACFQSAGGGLAAFNVAARSDISRLPTRAAKEIRLAPLAAAGDTLLTREKQYGAAADSVSWTEALLWGWALLTSLLVFRLLLSCLSLSARKNRASPAPAHLASRLPEWLRQCGSSRRDVRLLSSTEIATPMAAGFRRAAILIPQRLFEELDDEQLDQIGLHETAHLARRDDYVLVMQRAIEAFFAWHPAVHWIVRRIELERELACDDFVVTASGNVKCYALCLTRVVELAGGERVSLTASAAVEERSHLAARVALLLDRTRHKGTRLLKVRLASLALAVIALSAVVLGAPRLIRLAAPLAFPAEHAPQQVPAQTPTPKPLPSERPAAPPVPLSRQQPDPSPAPAPQSRQELPSETLALPQPVPTPKPEAVVRVSTQVIDPLNRFVAGLEREHFKLYEDGIEQEISGFSTAASPVSIGIVLDTSGSMSYNLRWTSRAVSRFLSTSTPQDEFSLIMFADRAWIVSGFTSKAEEIQSRVDQIQSKGKTALLDAIYLSLAQMRTAANARTGILIISDGDDNASRYTESEIRALVREVSGVNIYAIRLTKEDSAISLTDSASTRGPGLLRDITEHSGGQLIEVADRSLVPDTALKVAVELRNLYTLTYTPHHEIQAGKYRQIRIDVVPPRGLPALRVRHRAGYFAPEK